MTPANIMFFSSHAIEFVKHDGGRAEAGYATGSDAGDCVTRAIAIAADLPYKTVYDELFKRGKEFWSKKLSGAKLTSAASPRNGILKTIYEPYIEELGFKWTATMSIGSGCQVHLRADELPSGVLIVRLSRHVAAVIDGVLYDTYDCSREGRRCVYGYWVR